MFVPPLLKTAVLALAVAMGCGAAQTKELVIGQVAPFGGPLAVSGRDFNLGAMIALDEINSAGGIDGQRLRLLSRDDGYRSAETVRHVTDMLAQYQPLALIGMWGAENVAALDANQLLESTGLPIVGVRSGALALRRNPALFHLRASYRDEVHRILDQLKTMGSTRIAVLYEDDDFGREAVADAQAALALRQLKPVLVAAQARNDLKVDVTLDAAMAAQPQVVLLVANTPVAAALIKGLRERNLSAFVFATSTVDAEQLMAQLGAKAAGVAVAQAVPNPYKATAPVAMAFKQRIKALGINPARANFASLEGYIVARVVAEGLRRAGRDPGRRELARALESLHRYDLGGFQVDFGANQHEGSRYVDLSLVGADGRIRQ